MRAIGKSQEKSNWKNPLRSLGFPGGSDGKECARNAGDPNSIPGSGRSPGEGIGYPLQYSWASLVAQLVRNPACNAGDLGFIPGLGRSPGEGKGYPLQYSGLENSMDCSPPGSSVHGILQARALEWVAMPSSSRSSQPRNQTRVSCIACRFFTS